MSAAPVGGQSATELSGRRIVVSLTVLTLFMLAVGGGSATAVAIAAPGDLAVRLALGAVTWLAVSVCCSLTLSRWMAQWTARG